MFTSTLTLESTQGLACSGMRTRTAGLTVGALAAQAGLTPDTLRYYERVGLLAPPARSRGGYRLYDDSALERLSFIQKAQALSLSLGEIRDVLHLAADGTQPCRHVRQSLERKVAEIDERIEALRSLRSDLVRALRRDVGSLPADACVCGIIEQADGPAPLARGTSRAARRGRR